MYANPVPGYIHPMGWSRPSGNIEFVVTRGCREHLATGVGCALDIGNGRQGAPVFAMEAGKVTSRYIQDTPGQVGHGALIMRLTHAGRLDGGGYRSTGYAHLQSFSVALGAVVTKGQQIGVLGATGYGITGPHLHTDSKLHTTAHPAGVGEDLWPLLDQNISGGADVIQGANPVRIANRATTVKAASTNFRPDPSTAKPALIVLPAGAPYQPHFVVDGQAVGGSVKWYAGFVLVNGKNTLGYLHESVVNPLAPIEAGGGYTEADLTKAKLDAAAAVETKWETWNTQAQAGKP